MNDKMLWPLFSKPVFKTYVDVSDVDLSNIKWAQNYQNWISSSQQVLDEPEFKELGNKVYQGVAEYFYGIMQASPNVELYITESWFNKTVKGQTHHRHWHPNSLLSAVVFLESEGESGRIKFITSQYDMIEYNILDSNLYNSRSWSVIPEKGSMLIFPSNVEHMVEEYLSDTPRVSLAFNTFIRGNVNSDPLTRLTL
jgi:uncharacterized protein (TIGR02466 family)